MAIGTERTPRVLAQILFQMLELLDHQRGIIAVQQYFQVGTNGRKHDHEKDRYQDG